MGVYNLPSKSEQLRRISHADWPRFTKIGEAYSLQEEAKQQAVYMHWAHVHCLHIVRHLEKKYTEQGLTDLLFDKIQNIYNLKI